MFVFLVFDICDVREKMLQNQEKELFELYYTLRRVDVVFVLPNAGQTLFVHVEMCLGWRKKIFNG